jgi:cleavage and polyadenylation specificity factor subunit 2
VIISHPDQAHLGALPYLVGRLKLQASIYVTVPCHKMGQMFLYDHFLSRQQSSDFDVFTLDDVDLAFQRMRQLKYQQQVKLKGHSPSIPSHPEGHGPGLGIYEAFFLFLFLM